MAYLEGGKASYESLTAFHTYFNQLPTDTFAVDMHGTISGTAPAEALEFAKSKGIATFATVSNFDAIGFDANITHAILNESKARAQTIQQMLTLVKQWGYTGINIDFESIDYSDRKAFTSFVHDVAQKMRAAKYLTVVSVTAELKDNPQDSWTGAFDFAALGKTADILQVMTYDQHGPWGLPGPVAGLNWVEPCVVYAASVVAPGKLSLGIPAYGIRLEPDRQDRSPGVLERYSGAHREERRQAAVGQRLVIAIFQLPSGRWIKPCGLV